MPEVPMKRVEFAWVKVGADLRQFGELVAERDIALREILEADRGHGTG